MSELSEALVLISKDLDIPLSEEIQQIDAREELLKFLTRAIQELIDHDFNKLLVTLYRIDIPESKVTSIIEVEDPDRMARSLAEIVLTRELQKVETRRKYRSS